MPKTDRHKQRKIIILSVVLLAAIIGVSAINIGRATAGEKTATGADNAVNSQPDNESHTAILSPGVPTGSIVKMVSALVIVIFSIYFCIFLLKKFMGRRYSGRGRDNLLEVLESTSVGPKKMVSLVRVADKSVLIGVTDQSISVLTELNADETASLVKIGTQTAEKADFSGFLKSATNRLKDFGIGRNKAALDN